MSSGRRKALRELSVMLQLIIAVFLMQFCLPQRMARIHGLAHLFVSQECPPHQVQMTCCSPVPSASLVTDRRELFPVLCDVNAIWVELVAGGVGGICERRKAR